MYLFLTLAIPVYFGSLKLLLKLDTEVNLLSFSVSIQQKEP